MRARTGWAFMAPALLLIGAVTIFPIVYSFYMSFNHISMTFNGYHMRFIGLANYVLLLKSGLFRYSLLFTIFYAIATVVAELFLGLFIALILQRLSGGRPFLLALLLIPWSLITVISAEMWSYIYNGVYGVLNAILMASHIVGTPVNWLGKPTLAIIATMFADVWKTTPFVAVILLAGLEMIPMEIGEAARIDGAGPFKLFWSITLPLLKPTIGLAVLFRTLQAFGLFDLPFVLTGGGPGHATESIALLGYQVMFQDLKMGPGAAVASLTTLIVAIGAMSFLWMFRALAEPS